MLADDGSVSGDSRRWSSRRPSHPVRHRCERGYRRAQLKVLGLSLADVDTVILSHNHGDHTTGLSHCVGSRIDVTNTLRTAYVGKGIFAAHCHKR